jgi:hypothetical protein
MRADTREVTPSAGGQVPLGRSRPVINGRAVSLPTEDPDSPLRPPGGFIPSFRHYQPNPGDLGRDEVLSALSAADRLVARPRSERDDAVLDLRDDETIAAAIMLVLAAADRGAPSASGRFGAGGRADWKIPGLARHARSRFGA